MGEVGPSEISLCQLIGYHIALLHHTAVLKTNNNNKGGFSSVVICANKQWEKLLYIFLKTFI